MVTRGKKVKTPRSASHLGRTHQYSAKKKYGMVVAHSHTIYGVREHAKGSRRASRR